MTQYRAQVQQTMGKAKDLFTPWSSEVKTRPCGYPGRLGFPGAAGEGAAGSVWVSFHVCSNGQ